MTDRQIAELVLTPAEWKTWQLHHRGLSQRSIAHALDISRSTVRSRLENAARKIDAHRRRPAA